MGPIARKPVLGVSYQVRLKPGLGEHSGSVAQTPEREVRGLKPTPPCCVLEQDTLLSESTGNTQKAVAPSRHD